MANAEKPTRLKIPSPDARSARTVFTDGLAFADITDIKVVFVPIVQWGAFRIRLRVTGAAGVVGVEFARPARQIAPGAPTNAFVYPDVPAADATAWVTATNLVLNVTAAEHVGENWLKLTLDPAAAAVIDFCDVSGELLGTYH